MLIKIFYGITLAFVLILSPAKNACAETMADYTNTPIFMSNAVPPLVMLLIQRDERLYHEAYNDYSDLDDDGEWDITYKHSVNYYGYFDSYKCYTYSSTNGRYEPAAVTTDKYCDSVAGDWSGNFLNWATMTRMDTMRKVLYGGKRYADDNTETVLTRAFLPQDAHSFVKVYAATDISKLTPFSNASISLCNTTLSSTSNPPVVRVASGEWHRWASLERWQCAYDEEKGNSTYRPSSSTDRLGGQDYIVRVKVAVSGLEGNERTKDYPNGNIKPIGLLQQYGEDSNMYFGLITGSFTKNKSGGILRSKMTDVGDSNSGDVNRTSGVFTGQQGGIIYSLNELTMTRYNYSDGTYNSTDNCSWGLASFTDGNCSNWGNPLAEQYFEALRYFAGKVGNTAEYFHSGSDYINNLKKETWNSTVDPYSYNPTCARSFILTISDTFPSYDSDQLPGSYFGSLTSDLSLNVQTLTNTVGTLEGISGQYFVGQSGSTTDSQCTAKTVSNLGQVRGLCPAEPGREGSYYLAGLAYYGKTTDLRTDTGTQNVTSYNVALSSGAPEIDVTVGSASVTIIPSCFNNSIGKPCSLVNFRVISKTATNGEFYFNWEDSQQGGDYDQDADGRLLYSVSGNTITVETRVEESSTPYDMRVGYVISGTTTDGIYLEANNNEVEESSTPYDMRVGYVISGTTTDGIYLEANNNEAEGSYSCSDSFACASRAHTGGTSTAQTLKNPLWLASKYGGFTDSNNNNQPDVATEWDADGNGEPDSYFFVDNPLEMEAKLIAALNSILNKTSSGTALSVLATSATGAGNVYQAFFIPSRNVTDGATSRTINWLGHLISLNIDASGNLRDGSNNCIKFQYDSGTSQTLVQTLTESGGNCSSTVTTEAALTDWGNYVWDAGSLLAARTASSRTIYGYLDTSNPLTTASTIGLSPTTTLFTSGNASSYRKYLKAADDAEATNIINFIRGEHISAYRDRRDENGNVWKLGDIIHSTPTVISTPAEAYGLLYQDDTYTTFNNYWTTTSPRSPIVITGANDGLLHAFDASTGVERWAFMEHNLLPHLKWLTDDDYTHVNYMDAKAKVSDVQIFSCDSWHRGQNPVSGKCWGTILLTGMRMGGGEIKDSGYDVDGNGDSPSTKQRRFTSSYLAMDSTLTTLPQFKWEFGHHLDKRFPTLVTGENELGFTTSYPAVAKVGTKWFAIFGSGPKAAYTPDYNGTPNQTAKLFVVNLETGDLEAKFTVGDGTSMFADPIAVDIDFSKTNPVTPAVTDPTTGNNYVTYNTDAIYIGETYYLTGGGGSWNGRMWRLVTNNNTNPANWTMSLVMNTKTGQSIVSAPSATTDTNGKLWLYFGTGKYYSDADKADTTLQTFYGIKDPCWDSTNNTWNSACLTSASSVGDSTYTSPSVTNSTSTLIDTTSATVTVGGSLSGATGGGGSTPTTFSELQALSETAQGWFMDFSLTGERALNKPTVIGGLVLFTSFVPTTDPCGFGGNSYFYSIFYTTGTAFSESTIGTSGSGESAEILRRSTSSNVGLGSAVAIHSGRESGARAFVQFSTGEAAAIDFSPAIEISSGIISWRDL